MNFFFSVIISSLVLLVLLGIVFGLFWFLFEGRCTFGQAADKKKISVVPQVDLDNTLKSFIESFIDSYNKNGLVVFDTKLGYDGGYHQTQKTIDYGPLYYLKRTNNEFVIKRGNPNFSFGLHVLLYVKFESNAVEITGNKFLLPYKVKKNTALLYDFAGKLAKELNNGWEELFWRVIYLLAIMRFLWKRNLENIWYIYYFLDVKLSLVYQVM